MGLFKWLFGRRTASDSVTSETRAKAVANAESEGTPILVPWSDIGESLPMPDACYGGCLSAKTFLSQANDLARGQANKPILQSVKLGAFIAGNRASFVPDSWMFFYLVYSDNYFSP